MIIPMYNRMELQRVARCCSQPRKPAWLTEVEQVQADALAGKPTVKAGPQTSAEVGRIVGTWPAERRNRFLDMTLSLRVAGWPVDQADAEVYQQLAIS